MSLEEIVPIDARRGDADLDRLLAVTQALVDASTVRMAIEVALSAGLAAFDALTGGGGLVTPDGTHIELIGFAGLNHAAYERFRLVPIRAPYPMTTVVQTGAPEWIETPDEYVARYPEFARQTLSLSPARAFACAPILVRGRAIGALRWGFLGPRRFDARDRKLTEILALECAIAIDRVQRAEADRAARDELDATACGIAFFDRDLRCVRMNRYLAARLGGTPETIEGRRLGEFAAHIADAVEPHVERVIATGEPIFDQDIAGRDRHCSVTFHPVLADDGTVRTVGVTAIDVTPQREAEAAHSASEERLRLALAAARMFAWEWDPASQRMTYSDTAERILGVAPDTKIDTPDGLLALLHPDDASPADTTSCNAVARGDSYVRTFRIVRPVDGAVVWLESRGQGVLDAEGKVVRAHGVVMDVTVWHEAERQRAEAELTNHVKDEFLARVSHELRTPLAAMRMWIQVLRAGRPEDRAPAIEAVDKSARAQSKLIEDILDLARGLNGKLRITTEIFDPRAPIEEAVAVMRRDAEAKSILLLTSYASNAGFVRGDPDRLQQVVSNLLANAVKFTPDGGRIEVLLKDGGPDVVISVSDTGPGIEPSSLHTIFTPFQQHERASLPSHGGLGLGLAISRQLVELHGGNIRADSRGEGLGATFTVTLPRVPEEDVPPSPSQERTSPTHALPLDGLRILLLEDHAATREGIALVLSSYGAHVTATSAVHEALEALPIAKPHVILSDLAMPDEDGCSFIRKVRQLGDELGRTPAVALTALARPEDAARAVQAGFQIHLAKPVGSQCLVTTIATLAGRSLTRPRRRGRRTAQRGD